MSHLAAMIRRCTLATTLGQAACAIADDGSDATIVLDNRSTTHCLRYDEAVLPGEDDALVVAAGTFSLGFDIGPYDAGTGTCSFDPATSPTVCAFRLADGDEGRATLDGADNPPVLRCD
jgi:hypothetical protein